MSHIGYMFKPLSEHTKTATTDQTILFFLDLR